MNTNFESKQYSINKPVRPSNAKLPNRFVTFRAQQQDRFESSNILFPNDTENMHLSQGLIGNCQSLSSIDSLSQNKKGAEILKNMVKMNPDNKSVDVYFACTKEPINISLEVLEKNKALEDNTDKKFKDKLKFFKKYLITKNRDHLHVSHERPLGVHAIEYAYAKYQKQIHPNDFVDDKPKSIYDAPKFHSSSHIFLEDTTGLPVVTISSSDYLPTTRKHRPTLSNSITTTQNQVKSVLKNISENPDSYVVTACTSDDCEKRFTKWHDYSVRRVDFDKQEIVIANPWNNKYPQKISIDDFMNNFENITYIKL